MASNGRIEFKPLLCLSRGTLGCNSNRESSLKNYRKGTDFSFFVFSFAKLFEVIVILKSSTKKNCAFVASDSSIIIQGAKHAPFIYVRFVGWDVSMIFNLSLFIKFREPILYISSLQL